MLAACAASQSENSTPTTLAASMAWRSSGASSSSSRATVPTRLAGIAACERVGRHLEMPALAAVREVSLAHQVIDRRHEKQRIAARQSIQDRRRLARDLFSELQIEVVGSLRRRERGCSRSSEVCGRASRSTCVRRSVADAAPESDGRMVARSSSFAGSRRWPRLVRTSIVAGSAHWRSSIHRTSVVCFGEGFERGHDLAQHARGRGHMRPRGEGSRGRRRRAPADAAASSARGAPAWR